jgi:hypothetical protein
VIEPDVEEEGEEVEDLKDLLTASTEEEKIAAFHKSASEGIVLQGFLKKQSPTKIKGLLYIYCAYSDSRSRAHVWILGWQRRWCFVQSYVLHWSENRNAQIKGTAFLLRPLYAFAYLITSI